MRAALWRLMKMLCLQFIARAFGPLFPFLTIQVMYQFSKLLGSNSNVSRSMTVTRRL